MRELERNEAQETTLEKEEMVTMEARVWRLKRVREVEWRLHHQGMSTIDSLIRRDVPLITVQREGRQRRWRSRWSTRGEAVEADWRQRVRGEAAEAEGARGGGGGRGSEGRRRAWQRSRGEAAEAEIATGGGGGNAHGRGPNPFSASATLSAACCCVCRRQLSLSPSPSPILPPPTSVLRPTAADDLNFNDHHKLFSHLPTSDLIRSAAVLHATAVDPLIDFGTWLLLSNLMNINGLRKILLTSVRHSFYNHFCFGEDAAAAAKSIQALSRADLRGLLVYSVEDALDNHDCDRNFHGFLRTVDVSRSTWSSWRCGWRAEAPPYRGHGPHIFPPYATSTDEFRIIIWNMKPDYGHLDHIAVLALITIAMLAIFSTKGSYIFNNVATIIHFFFIIVAGTNNLTPFVPYDAHGVIKASAVLLFAYMGFNAVSTMKPRTLIGTFPLGSWAPWRSPPPSTASSR
ncbi:hypothetical protein Fmac_016263 [Flemingia macrophylla]|uniref:Proline dehydrogenase n=1 Tax=Flemingia macrophylla TaxID=520843 RepID=A0ABD1MGX4_9FABA